MLKSRPVSQLSLAPTHEIVIDWRKLSTTWLTRPFIHLPLIYLHFNRFDWFSQYFIILAYFGVWVLHYECRCKATLIFQHYVYSTYSVRPWLVYRQMVNWFRNCTFLNFFPLLQCELDLQLFQHYTSNKAEKAWNQLIYLLMIAHQTRFDLSISNEL